MIINDFNTNDKVLVIAEIGNNHEGSYTLAEELIGLAADAGVDAIKFQTFKTRFFVSHVDKDRYEKLKSFELSQNEFEKLKKVAKAANLLFISTPLDIDSADFLAPIVDAMKISSGDNNFYPLIEKIALYSKPTILSTGLADLNQIIKSKNIISDIWESNNIEGELGILHCVASYPVKPKFANLLAIQTLIDKLNCTIGYSDHTLGINGVVAAVSLGARIIEKHFTKDREYSDFRDHQLSCDPNDMKNMVNAIREIEKMLGSGEKNIQTSEIENLVLMRRSIVAKNSLLKGDTLQSNDITWLRPGGGFNPGEESQLIGKKLKKNISKGMMILPEHLKNIS